MQINMVIGWDRLGSINRISHILIRLLACTCSFKHEPRNLSVMVVWDGVQPFKDDSKYSITPIMVVTTNAPVHLRWSPALSHLVTIVPGSREGGINPASAVDMLVDELRWLYYEGVKVWDAHARKEVRVYVRLLRVLSDIRGLQGLVGEGMKTTPARIGAEWRTWLEGIRRANKTIYGPHQR